MIVLGSGPFVRFYPEKTGDRICDCGGTVRLVRRAGRNLFASFALPIPAYYPVEECFECGYENHGDSDLQEIVFGINGCLVESFDEGDPPSLSSLKLILIKEDARQNFKKYGINVPLMEP